MDLKDYLSEKSGRAEELAKKLGLPASNISFWKSGAKGVPPHQCVAIEKATNGAVTRKDLRPNDWADIWPELGAN